MATAGKTTLSTTDTTLLATPNDNPVSEMVFYNLDATNDVLVHVTPIHAVGDYLSIPPTPASVAPVPVYIKGLNDKITSVTAKGRAGTPIVSWAVSGF